ncbi:hypothetical protein WL82_24510 [Burkholderia ubonensis]|uniref:hypothetical protein n=1 Tax=Burkholderia ubonensis TaxID=101571 RepID=UPI000753A017|nr:hypothetical protein [Burkholderia ubonensis]KWE97458.1 hypothetical protein WL82_24510 [Burkholderia ubonensis]
MDVLRTPLSQILQKLTISCGGSLYAWYFCDMSSKVGKIAPTAHRRQGSVSIDAMNQCDDSPVRSPHSGTLEQVHIFGCPAPPR